MRKILAPLLLAVLAASMTSVAFAYDSGTIKPTSEQVADQNHTFYRIDTSVFPHVIIIRSSVVNGTVENHFGLLFSTIRATETGLANGLVIHVAFSHETDIGDVENQEFFHLRVAYLALTEFSDTNGNGALDAGVDTVLKTVPLNKTYDPLHMPMMITDDQGRQGWELYAITTDASFGSFSVKADIFPQYAVVDRTIVPPTATKITTTINNFPFTNPGDANDKVALQVMATSTMVLEHDTPTSEERVRVRSATANGFYTWASTAQVDGTTVNVASSIQRLDRARWIINLAYPQGTTIVHDPVLGFDLGATPILTGRLLIGAAIAAIAVFGILVYLGRRQLVRVFNPKPFVQ